MSDERVQILNMLRDGKITVEEADRLLEAVNQTARPLGDAGGETAISGKARFLRVRVWEGGKPKVNVNIPLNLAKIAMRFIPRSALEKAGHKIDFDEIVGLIQQGASGKLVEVEDGNERVEILVTE